MNNSAPTAERLERLLGLKTPPASSRNRRFLYRLAIAVYVAGLVGSVYFFVNPGSRAMTFYQATSLVWVTTAFGFIISSGLCAGAYGRLAGRFGQVGRILRVASVVAFAAVFPLFCVAAGGYFTSDDSGSWTSGALVGAVVGLGWVLLGALQIIRYHRKRGNR